MLHALSLILSGGCKMYKIRWHEIKRATAWGIKQGRNPTRSLRKGSGRQKRLTGCGSLYIMYYLPSHACTYRALPYGVWCTNKLRHKQVRQTGRMATALQRLLMKNGSFHSICTEGRFQREIKNNYFAVGLISYSCKYSEWVLHQKLLVLLLLVLWNWQSFVRLPESPSAQTSQSFTPCPHGH